MTTLLALWKLNRISVRRKGILYEYVGYAKSESKPNTVYHVVVRVAVTPTGRLTLTSFTCECRAFIHGLMCKHVKALYNKATRDIRARLMYDMPMLAGGDPF
jgi:hypothetical protein